VRKQLNFTRIVTTKSFKYISTYIYYLGYL